MIMGLKREALNREMSLWLTNAGVPPEYVPVENVEGEMSEAAWDLAVEILPVERTAGKRQTGVRNCYNVSLY